MDILKFMKDEGFVTARYSTLEGKDIHFPLNELGSSEDLYNKLNIQPTQVEYFPYERVPYLSCCDETHIYKLCLFK